MRGTHLSKHFIQPLQWTIQMYFNPTRCTCDILAMIFSTPSFHKAHPNGAHFGELINCLKAMIDRLTEQGCKFLVVEYFQAASWGNLAYSGWMEPVVVITVAALNEYTAVAQAFSKYFPSHVI